MRLKEIKLKPCPFCGGKVHINKNTECTDFAKELVNIYDKHSDCLRVPFKSAGAIYDLCSRHEPLRRKHTEAESLAYMQREIIKKLILESII